MENDGATQPIAASEAPRPSAEVARFRLWHMVLLVAFVAFAIVDIQDHRRTEPFLLGLAGAGFAAYAVLAWLAWAFARRFEGRINRVALVGLYLASMAGLFLFATVAYLMIEQAYLSR